LNKSDRNTRDQRRQGGLLIRVCSITLTAAYSQRQRDDGGRAEVAV
jgi:hypothetical protein